jgi:Na+/H+ antiporter NhaC
MVVVGCHGLPVKRAPLDFHGGLAGILAPFALFLTGVGWLGLTGAPDERGFWPVLLAALTLGLLLARDRTRYCDVVIEGMSRPIVMLMISAWLLAGALGALMSQTGFIEALVWLVRRASLGGGSYVAAAFLICAVVSTSTGTSFGTILICGPLLYPAGGSAGAAPAALAGAILGGATFGDSISPISDTTISSAGTQGADIGGVVRARLKYVLPAGLLAVLVSGAFGGGPVSAPAAALQGSPRGLLMLAVPAFVVGLLLNRRHLVEGLLLGVLASSVLGVLLGLMPLSALLRVPPGSYAARSVIIDGLERGVGVSIFTLLLIGLVAALEATEVLDRLVRLARRRTLTARGAESWIVAAVSGAVLLTTHSVVAILTVGEFAREAGGRFGLSGYRRANLLDITVCTYPFLLPYFLPTILMSSATASGSAFAMPRVSPLTAGLWNVYSWGLAVMVVVAVTTGYGRGERAPAGAERIEDNVTWQP